jgi:hypothetical protein
LEEIMSALLFRLLAPRRWSSFRLVAAFAMLLGPGLVISANPSAAVAAVPTQVVPSATSPRSLPLPAAAPSAADDSYAAREAQAKPLENFKGGDTTIILGGSVLVIVLIVVLIVVLI